ncbi:hypothetical protein, partial [Amycolatopsis sp. NPDC001319]|uniref:hypothetical protein n=1 Tax=Amycolatopsis sp. NPDC001319 TaxID=3363922 RepID=UPI0036B12877
DVEATRRLGFGARLRTPGPHRATATSPHRPPHLTNAGHPPQPAATSADRRLRPEVLALIEAGRELG